MEELVETIKEFQDVEGYVFRKNTYYLFSSSLNFTRSKKFEQPKAIKNVTMRNHQVNATFFISLFNLFILLIFFLIICMLSLLD